MTVFPTVGTNITSPGRKHTNKQTNQAKVGSGMLLGWQSICPAYRELWVQFGPDHCITAIPAFGGGGRGI